MGYHEEMLNFVLELGCMPPLDIRVPDDFGGEEWESRWGRYVGAQSSSFNNRLQQELEDVLTDGALPAPGPGQAVAVLRSRRQSTTFAFVHVVAPASLAMSSLFNILVECILHR